MAYIDPGSVLNDRFLLISELGSGTFGLTHHSFDLELKHNVAIKFLKNASPSAKELKALKAEEQMVNSLTSPYVIKSLGYFPGVGSNPADLICFEYPQGAKTLDYVAAMLRGQDADYSHEGALLSVLTLLAQCADGLGALHEKEILHRDLKPNNIVVDLHFRAKLIDFGLAAGTTSLNIRARAGTSTTLAPEIGRGPATFQSDVYSLGTSMFNVLLGAWPGLNLPYDLTDLNCASVSTDFKSSLNSVFLKATELHPENRYGNGTEMAKDLWALVMELKSTSQENLSAHRTKPIHYGHVNSIADVIEQFNKIAAEAEAVRQPYHRLDGLLLPPERKFSVSNRTGAFIFFFKGVQYQINSDTLRKSMYRLVDYAERTKQTSKDFDRLLTPITTADGTRALRLASYLPNVDGKIPANGFYCYACEDMERLNRERRDG